MDYDFRMAQVVQTLRKIGANRVLIQLPNGLKKYYSYVAENLRKIGIQSYLSLSHSWGPCDLALKEAASTKCDTLLHVGHHSRIHVWRTPNLNIVFSPAFFKKNPRKVVEEAISILKERKMFKIGVFTTVQHITFLSECIHTLEENGFKIYVRGAPFLARGQLLGCNLHHVRTLKDKVDAFLVISGGLFHPIGVFFASEKPVIQVDPYRNLARDVTDAGSRILKIRLYYLLKALDAKSFGVIVSTKPGQRRLTMAEHISRILGDHGYNTSILVCDEVDLETLENVPWIDAFVITACPRIALDFQENFKRPLLNPGEVKYVLSRSVESYDPFDSLNMLPSISSLQNVKRRET